MNNLAKKVYSRLFGRKAARQRRMIAKYRQFDQYQLDHEAFPAMECFISSKLPSEPPEGINYNFGPSGYNGSKDSDYCIIATTWWNSSNYCHWSFSELPYLMLAFESEATNIVLPDELIKANQPFQKEWMETLHKLYPGKNILPYSLSKFPDDSLIPVNHDTSSSKRTIGECLYRHYHVSRATPYLISRISNKYKDVLLAQSNYDEADICDYIYINRETRRLKNEKEIQKALEASGFKIDRKSVV